jgi:uncharacterized phage infection (PIP) family protein YhgE
VLQIQASEISEWLYEGGLEADTDAFRTRFNSLNQLHDPIFKRRAEYLARPEAVEQLNKVIADIRSFVAEMEKTLEEDGRYTQEELSDVKKSADDAEQWLTEQLAAQAAVAADAEPVVLAHTIRTRSDQIQAMLDKLKRKPRPSKKTTQTKTEQETTNTATETKEASTAEETATSTAEETATPTPEPSTAKEQEREKVHEEL